METASLRSRPYVQPMSTATAPGDTGTVPASIRARKGTLHCPHCGHASPADGDWIAVLDREGLASLRCPVCRAHIATRWRTTDPVPRSWDTGSERS